MRKITNQENKIMKAKLKNKKSDVPLGVKIIDLSVEKRTELFIEEFDKFTKESSEVFGIGIIPELVYNTRGLVPRLAALDLLKKNEEAKKNPKTK